MKIKFAKKLIIPILSVLIFMLALFSVIKVIHVNTPSGADLTISTLDELQSFANSVYAYNNAGNSYSGKTVVLGADIDCGGEELTIGIQSIPYGPKCSPTFNGTFDGQGHTISNFCLTDAMTIVTMTAGGYSSFIKATGMFLRLGPTAQVINLKISNVSCSLIADSGYGGHTLYVNAGMVGYMDAGAQVSSCVVENMTGGCGIVASGAGSVSNCYVNNASSAGIGPSSETHTMGTSSLTNTTSISNCVVKNCSSISALSTTNCYKDVAEKYPGLNVSSAGGANLTIWYHSKDYNDGYPFLRQFITTWKTIYFVPNNADYGMVSISSIQIPSDANKTYTSGGEAIEVYSQVALATPKEGCYFVNWTQSGNTYTANFAAEQYNLTFNFVDSIGNTINNGLDNNVTLKVKRNDSFSLYVYYSKESTIVKLHDIEICNVNSKYMIKSYVFNGVEFDFVRWSVITIPDLGEHNQTYVVTITLDIKDYKVEYK